MLPEFKSDTTKKMGNNYGHQATSSTKYGTIYMRLDRPFYYSGDTVTGTVYLHIKMPYPGNKVNIEIEGCEKV